jgi:hypothetical protein
MKRLPTSVIAVLATFGLLAVAATAQAAERRCDGAIGPETVRGNLVVPEGEICDLAGTRVLGTTSVREGAELYAQEAGLRGVNVARGGYVDLIGSSVGGLRLSESLGATAQDSSIGGISSAGSEFLALASSAIRGDVSASGGRTAVFGEVLEIGGNVEAAGVDFFDLHDSSVDGNFSVRDTQAGSVFCGNELNGNSELTRNAGQLTVGSPEQSCAGNSVNGNLIVTGNTAESEISDNDVNGNLTCRGNEPPPAGGGNRVNGNKEGQCRAL